MILKCGECGHLMDIEDPASGWEENLNIGVCSNCSTHLSSPVRQVNILNYLLVFQFISLGFVIQGLIFDLKVQTYIWPAVLVASSVGLLFLNNKKGTPIVLKRIERVGIVKE